MRTAVAVLVGVVAGRLWPFRFATRYLARQADEVMREVLERKLEP